MFNWLKNIFNGKLRFFVLVHKDNPLKFLTITTTRKDAIEYANALLKNLHLEHFTLWCNVRNYVVDDPSAWLEYLINCINQEELKEYKVVKIYTNKANMAVIMRLFNGCVPLGCDFESDLEIKVYDKKLDELKSKVFEV